jgi:hypothetical protein
VLHWKSGHKIIQRKGASIDFASAYPHIAKRLMPVDNELSMEV